MNGFLHLKSQCLTKQNHIIITYCKTTRFYFEVALVMKLFWCWLIEEYYPCSSVCQVLEGCTRPNCCVCNSPLNIEIQRMLTDVWGGRLRSLCNLFISTPLPLWQVPAYVFGAPARVPAICQPISVVLPVCVCMCIHMHICIQVQMT